MTEQTTTDDSNQATPFSEWVAGLGDDDKAYIEKNGYSDFSHLLASDKGAMAKLGRPATELLIKPKGDYSDETKDSYLEVMRALGAPAEKTGYGEAPKLDGLEFKDGAWDKLTDVFTSAGVPPFMVAPVLVGVAEIVKGELGAQKAPEVVAQERFDAGMAKLKETHGAKADTLVADVKALIGVKDKEGSFAAFLEESGFGSDPRFINFLSSIEADYKESGLLERDGARSDPSVMTPEQAREELRKLEADEGFNKQLMTANDPNHAQAVKRRNDLAALAYPNGA